MQKTEIAWRNYGNWKARYSKLYSSRHSDKPVEDPVRRISFMAKDAAPNRLFLKNFRSPKDSGIYGESLLAANSMGTTTVLSEQSDCYSSSINIAKRNDTSEIDTLLLEKVRARSRELNEESLDKTLKLPRDDVSDTHSSEACVHGLTMRMTDRSISRRSISRISRISTRRDMDIPSILAFTAKVTPAPAPLEIPAFQKLNLATDQDVPKWSIRRSVCPVCSQKWKDKSSINNIKSSGLKRNSSTEWPSVMAPARLRSSITMEYTPRPALAAVDEHKGIGVMRNSGASWQLTRARRFRIPKLQMPPPEARAPPSSTAPMAQKDLDFRVNRFLKDEGRTLYFHKKPYNYT